jgi:hypothetical protein
MSGKAVKQLRKFVKRMGLKKENYKESKKEYKLLDQKLKADLNRSMKAFNVK